MLKYSQFHKYPYMKKKNINIKFIYVIFEKNLNKFPN